VRRNIRSGGWLVFGKNIGLLHHLDTASGITLSWMCVYVRTLVSKSGKREYRIPFKKEAIASSISSGSA
jgi:hypothetical protein